MGTLDHIKLNIDPANGINKTYERCYWCRKKTKVRCRVRDVSISCENIVLPIKHVDRISRLNLILKMCDLMNYFVAVDKSYTGMHFGLFKGVPDKFGAHAPFCRRSTIEGMEKAVETLVQTVVPDFIV